MKNLLFVFNPNSGKGKLKNYLMKIVQKFSDAGYTVTVYPTKAERDGYEYVKKVEGKYDVIVCSGGDGTLNEITSAISEYIEEKPYIGYIPSGTTNDFAASMRIPKDMLKAADMIVDGTPRKCDIGYFNGRTFNYVAAFGAFTKVSYATSQKMKSVFGHQAYVIEGVKELTDLQKIKLKVKYEDGIIEDEFLYGMITNSKSVGGVKGVTGKDVKLDDGLFEVTLVKKFKNPLDFQQLISGIITQSIVEKDCVISFKTSHVQLISNKEISWTLDGEYGGDIDFADISVEKGAVEYLLKNRNNA